MTPHSLPSGACERGATLLEVLVSMVILGIGLLGVAGLQLTGLKSSYSAYQRSQATWLAYDIADRMRARPTGACTLYGNGSSDADRVEWDNLVETLLGAGAVGAVAVCDANNDVEIRISWSDERGNLSGAAGDTTAGDQTASQTFVYRTRL